MRLPKGTEVLFKQLVPLLESSEASILTMKVPGIITLALLPLSCFGAKKSTSGGRFEEYHARSQSSAPVRLDDASYEELTAPPRNHSVIVLLTALEARFGCQLCRDFQPEWDILCKSWARGDRNGESRTLLGTLDFAEGKGTFQKVQYTLTRTETFFNASKDQNQLISLHSLCYKPLPSYSYSHQRLGQMRNRMVSPFEWISLQGKSTQINAVLLVADYRYAAVLSPQRTSLAGSFDNCQKARNLPYSGQSITFASLLSRQPF